MSEIAYYPGATVTLANSFQVNGQYVDPTLITVYVVDPTGAFATLSSANGDFIKDSTGIYHSNYTLPKTAIAGIWTHRWESSGSVPSATEATFTVEASVLAEITEPITATVLTPTLLPNMYLPSGWDAAWRAAKALQATSPASLIAIGDSITIGQGATDFMIDAWWAKLRASLIAQYSLGGDYYGVIYSGYSQFDGLRTASSPIGTGGTPGTDWTAYYCGLTRGYDIGTATLAPFVFFVSPNPCVALDILYIDYNAGTPGFTYKVDGGTAIPVNTFGGGSDGTTASVKKISITGLANTTHRIDINTVGVANGVIVLGFTAYAQASAGIRFANHGWPGMGLIAGNATHNNLADTGQFPIDRLALYQGYEGTTASPTALTGLGFPTQPDLALIAFGVNDAANSGSATTFRDSLRRLVQSLRFGKSDACSILILGMYTGDNAQASSSVVTSTDYTGSATPGIQDFYKAMLEVAQEYGCGYASVHALFGRYAVTNGWVTSATNVHPTPAGHAKIAAFLEQVL